MQRRAYPRTPLERHGQVNIRRPHSLGKDTNHEEIVSLTPRDPEDRDKTPRHTREGMEPSCCIFVSKYKGFGTTGNKESMPTSVHGIALLNKSFSSDLFHKYRVNVYLKRVNDETRLAEIDWRGLQDRFIVQACVDRIYPEEIIGIRLFKENKYKRK